MRPRSAHSMAQAMVPPVGDRVEPELVAATAGLQDGVGVRHAAQRAEREHVLVLHARLLAARRPCRCARSRSSTTRSCRGRRRRASARSSAASARRVGERGGLEVARRQGRDGVEGEQVGERAELAVLRGRRAERARAQVACGGEDRRRVGGGDLRRRSDGDRLEELRAEDGAEAAATRVAAVVGDGRVLDQPLARRARSTRPARPCRAARAGVSRPRRPTVPTGRRRAPDAGRRRRAAGPTAPRRRRARRSRRGRSACRRWRSGWRRARR